MAKGSDFDTAALLAALQNKSGLAEMRRVATDHKRPETLRLRAVEVLAVRRDAEALPIATKMLTAKTSSPTANSAALATLPAHCGQLSNDTGKKPEHSGCFPAGFPPTLAFNRD